MSVQLEKSGEDMQMHFPITVATVPFRIPNLTQQPQIKYGLYIFLFNFICSILLIVFFFIYLETAAEHVEGGYYIGPEFLLGQVYDGTDHLTSQVPLVLYRPVYACIAHEKKNSKSLEN